MAAPKRQREATDQPTLDVILPAIEQIRSTMGASGIVLAIGDGGGLHSLASAGDVPAAGSNLQLDSEFTRECLETGRVVLCQDAYENSRIPLTGNARILRSAVAVPIHFRGSLLGIIQLFSVFPSAFNGTHVATLREIGGLLAPVLASESLRATRSESSNLDQIIARTEVLAIPAEEIYEEAEVVEFDEPSAEPVVAGSTGVQHLVSRLGASYAVLRRVLFETTAGRSVLAGSAAVGIVALFFLFSRTAPEARRAVATRDVPVTSESQRTSESRRTEDADGPALERATSPRGDTQIASSTRNSTLVIVSHKAASQAAQKSLSASAAVSPVNASAQLSVEKKQPQSVVPFDRNQSTNTASEISHDVNASSSIRNDAAALPLPSTPRVAAETRIVALENANSASMGRDASASVSATPAILKSASNSRPDFVLDHTVKGHTGWVTGVAFTADGKRLVSGSWDQTIKMWDVPSGTEVSTVGKKGKEVQAVAFSRDGRWLAAENSSDNVTLWDATTGTQIRILPTDKRLRGVGNNWVYSIAFSPDGRLLASAVDDRTVRLWDVKTGEVVRDLTANRRSVIYMAFSPDGRLLASGDDEKSITIWNVATGMVVRKLTGHKKLVYAVAFSPNGRWLASASADKTIKIWDVEMGREVHNLTGHSGLITSLAFSPDGRWLASGSWDKTIKIWDVESGNEVQSLGGHNHSIYTVAFDSRGRWIASGSEDGTISLWRWNRGEAARD
jgi:WD40 repeat protein